MNAEEFAILDAINAEHLAAGKTAAYGLSRAIGGDDDAVRVGAARLLELAVLTVSLVEKCVSAHQEAFCHASKKYPWFPILVTGRGRDANRKLKQIEDLSLGDDWPFKRFKGQAKNDDLWRAIEAEYMHFQSARLGNLTLSAGQIIDKEIDQLPPLNKKSAGKWARVMALSINAGPRGEERVRSLNMNLAKETDKKKRRKIKRIQAKFGGIRVEEVRSQGGLRYFPRTASGKRGKELSAVEATKLKMRIEAAQKMQPTKADIMTALSGAIKERLRYRLKK